MATKKASKAAGPEHKIVKRGDGRWAVRLKGGKYINGADKQKILAQAGKITLPKSKPKAEEAPAAAE
jgi:hypothetical protein